MKRFFKITILSIVILSLSEINTFSNPIDQVEDRLTSIGVKGEYIEGVLNHLSNLELNEDDVEKINENLKYILENTKGKTKVTDCSLSELYSLYSRGMEVAKGFDLKLSMNFFTQELHIKNSAGDVLFDSEFKEIEGLYKNYLVQGYKKEEDVQYLLESFSYDDGDLMAENIEVIEESEVKEININTKIELENNETLINDNESLNSINYEKNLKAESDENLELANVKEEYINDEYSEVNSNIVVSENTTTYESYGNRNSDLGKIHINTSILEAFAIWGIVIILSIYRYNKMILK